MKSSKKSKSEMYALIARWEESGMNQKAYCKSVSISYYTFKYWRTKKIKELKSNYQNLSQSEKHVKSFIPVEISMPRGNFAGIQLIYPNGVILKCSEGTQIDQLQELIKLY